MMGMQNRSPLNEMLDKLRAPKPNLELRHQVEELAVFGSFTKRKNCPRSDLDIQVSLREPPSLLRFIELENELSDNLVLKVDLVMREARKPRTGRRILEEMVPV